MSELSYSSGLSIRSSFNRYEPFFNRLPFQAFTWRDLYGHFVFDRKKACRKFFRRKK